MKQKSPYRLTILACYMGNISQAIVVNLTAILFIPLRAEYGFSYSAFGLLVLINFVTQVVTDIVFSKPVDRYGFRPFVVTAHGLCVAGFLLFMAVPTLFAGNEYLGFVIATMLFSAAGGLLELLLSPIVDALPSEAKDKSMSLLHSFYAIGQALTVAVTTISLFLGVHWRWIVVFWAIIPFINLFLFAKAPLDSKHHHSDVMRIRTLIKNPIFILAFLAIMAGAAAEVGMSQWASAFMERGLGMPKVVGDMLGICGFGLMLALGRILYGIYGHKVDLNMVLIFGSLGAVASFLVVALSPWAWLAVLGCVCCGFFTSQLWPGVLVIASEKIPMAGASMFALLAAGGDMGAAIGPWFTGVMTDGVMGMNLSLGGLTAEQIGLKAGVLIGVVFPICAFVLHLIFRRVHTKI